MTQEHTLNGRLEQALSAILSTLAPDFDVRNARGRFGILPSPTSAGDSHVSIDIALRLARSLHSAPLDIGQKIAAALAELPLVASAVVVKTGHVNIRFSTAAMVEAMDAGIGINELRDSTTIVDFGGPNIKPMHVGHLRSLTIGESVRRLLEHAGERVLSDIHWGDTGLPSGMTMAMVRDRHPDSPWFSCPEDGPYPDDLPCPPADIAHLYPEAARRSKEDKVFEQTARDMTRILQDGSSLRLTALWDALSAAAKKSLMMTVKRLDAHFDMLLGERDAESTVPVVLEIASLMGVAEEGEDGVMVIDVRRDGDSKEMPNLVLRRADGSSLYATTDLATLFQRRRDLSPHRVIYVVDDRQTMHFRQVFRAAEAMGIATPKLELVHRAFGTVNGPDGKPLRTRDGNVMPLDELLDLAVGKARARLVEGGRITDLEALDKAAECIGVSALKIADLSQPAASNYTLDIERSLQFEGNTGPSLLYAVVRLRALIEKAVNQGMNPWDKDVSCMPALSHGTDKGLEAAQGLALCISGFDDAAAAAALQLEPFRLTDWAFKAATATGRLWAECEILRESDPVLRASLLRLVTQAEERLSKAVGLLGCRVPLAM